MNRSRFATWASLLALGAVLLTTETALLGVTTDWQAPAGSPGDWWSAGNWADGTPDASLMANISNGGTAVLTDGNATCHRLRLGDAATESGHMIQNGGALTTGTIDDGRVFPGYLYVGYRGTGEYQQNAGLSNHGSVYVGYDSNSYGSYTVGASAALEVSSGLFVGRSGKGLCVQYGQVTVQHYVIVGAASGTKSGDGEYELYSGGALSAESYLSVGHGGIGVFTQKGGTVSSGGYVNVGKALSVSQLGDGTYELSDGGTLTADAYLAVGHGGVGAFTQKGGEVTADSYVAIGMGLSSSQPGHGTYELSDGGSLTTPGFMAIGFRGHGTMRQIDGDVTTTNLRVGHEDGGQGTYEVTAGVLDAGGIDVGYEADGTFKVIGGAADISGTEYEQYATGSLVSQVDAGGLSCINISGGYRAEADIDGTWTVIDDGAPLGRFDVLTAEGGIAGNFTAVNMPGTDWTWGITGHTLWVEHVPEPTTLALLALSSLVVLRRRHR